MKIYLLFFLIISSFLFSNCEEVIDLNLDQYEKRVVIDANIFAGEINYNKIRIYYSAPFYATNYEYITTANVNIKDVNTNTVYVFTYDADGYYENTNFVPNLSSIYELNITYNNNVYKAISNVSKAPIIEEIEQIADAGFTGNNIEIRFYYQDDEETEDYYLTQLTDNEENDFSVGNDQFTNGNLSYKLYFADEDQVGENLMFSLAKIDKAYYNYLNKMFSNSASAGNPFATPSGTLKGNINNLTNPNEFPLGYFHIAKRESVTYTIQQN